MAAIIDEAEGAGLVPDALSFLNLSNQFLRIAFRIVKNRKPERSLKDFSQRRLNLTMASVTDILTDKDFQRSFRMDRPTFQKLLETVSPHLNHSEEMGQLSKRPTVIPELRLGLFLRMMAGAAVHDVMTTYRVSRSTAFRIFHETRDAVNKAMSLPGLPDDVDGCKEKADGFQTSRSPPSPLPGCVGALDGICVRIKKPSEADGPAQYYCRKGYYSITVQAVCDSDYKFICYSAKCVGSTHDGLAHSVSALGQFLDNGNLPPRFWIAGDDAYKCSNSLVTPVPRTQANDEEDAFNFYHSSLRMHVEQAFGILTTKWRILQNIEFSVSDSVKIIGAAMKLHNFCILNSSATECDFMPYSDEDEKMLQESKGWYEQDESHAESSSPANTRNDLIKIIKEGGYCRPPVRGIRIPDHLNVPETEDNSQ